MWILRRRRPMVSLRDRFISRKWALRACFFVHSSESEFPYLLFGDFWAVVAIAYPTPSHVEWVSYSPVV